ncbi:DUF3533 domain-containing protein [Paenibacillus urinalis]|uniref:DUF3533 domain-containing protein n=1 Tax=Paenibacillus urinalis TaxID=521520 RepID=A0ABY7X4H9_9BACL|nr:DUF3533 domain-containing protein [Paenibacillus urinalis]WDH96729.1 DUF3533 domain-containing protein [Paenibacillus urinalis]WDI00373.1 DUF3533 domain-containing protein [Paenibacillus urinalis]
MFKNKLLIMAPVIALVVVFIFSLTLFPTVQPQAKNLPIAIVNEDEGVEVPGQPQMNMGQTIVDNVQKSTSTEEDSPVQWIEVTDADAVQQGLDQQQYYAALVIPQDFSAKQVSLQSPEPSSPEVQIYINQGMHMAASTAASQILSGIIDNMNVNVRNQILEGFEAQGQTLTPEQASLLAMPIVKNVINVNEVGQNSANGNAPVSLFQPLWIGSLATAAIIFMASSKMLLRTKKESLMLKIGQILIGVVAALVIGFGLTWIVDGMVGLNIPDFYDTAIFLSITALSYLLMILAVMSLVGFKGIAIFALLLFFGAPLLSLAPEMLSPFYHDYIYSWLPMRFMVEGLRPILFFGQGLSWNSDLSVLVWIGIVSMLVILATAVRAVKVQKDHEHQTAEAAN